MKLIISPYSRALRNGEINPKNYPNWEKLIEVLKQNGFYIIQIGITGEKELAGIDEAKFNLNLKDLAKLLSTCDTWISVDNFFPHFCHLYNKPGVVIFSQSDPNIFGHPENKNLLKDRTYLREKQFDIWECAKYDKDAYIDPTIVADVVLGDHNG